MFAVGGQNARMNSVQMYDYAFDKQLKHSIFTLKINIVKVVTFLIVSIYLVIAW